jgi:uncharacterized protein YfdQ (DUF2303 family)
MKNQIKAPDHIEFIEREYQSMWFLDHESLIEWVDNHRDGSDQYLIDLKNLTVRIFEVNNLLLI